MIKMTGEEQEKFYNLFTNMLLEMDEVLDLTEELSADYPEFKGELNAIKDNIIKVQISTLHLRNDVEHNNYSEKYYKPRVIT